MKTIVITGASDGIGLEAASQLAEQGHHLVLVGRTPAKLDAAVTRLNHESPDAPVESFVCDFASLASVRLLAEQLLAAYPRIDVLVDNAGTVSDKRTLTPDGHETTFAVNHLAPFLLTELLRERLVESAPSRIVITASDSHYQGTMDLADLGFEKGYFVMRSYARSKLANVLYTRSLAAQLRDDGVCVNAVHPGTVRTSIWRGTPLPFKPLIWAFKPFMIGAAEGGSRITQLATGDDVEGVTGEYFEKGRPKQAADLARDDALAQRLYEESRRLVGLPLPEQAP